MKIIRGVAPTVYLFVCLVVIAWAILSTIVVVRPALPFGPGVTSLVWLMALAPIIIVRFPARGWVSSQQRQMFFIEIIATFTLALVLIAPLSILLEAGLVYIVAGEEFQLDFKTILLQPLDKRYTLSGTWNMSVWQKAMISNALALLIVLPISVAMRYRRMNKDRP